MEGEESVVNERGRNVPWKKAVMLVLHVDPVEVRIEGLHEMLNQLYSLTFRSRSDTTVLRVL